MKISIITVVYNNKRTVQEAMNSVLFQDHEDLQYIIIDGGSRDGTIEAVAEMMRQFPERDVTFLSEKDHGMYDAMNKGIRMASGEIIGILNSDDIYTGESVLSRVVEVFLDQKTECVLGDMVITKRDDGQNIIRYYRSKDFNPRWFEYGKMPPHPAVFLRREIYQRHGLFKTDYRIAADFEFLTRIFKDAGITYFYIPEVLARMRSGGQSSRGIRSTLLLNREICRACRENGIRTNVLKIYSKYFTKMVQLWQRPSDEKT